MFPKSAWKERGGPNCSSHGRKEGKEPCQRSMGCWENWPKEEESFIGFLGQFREKRKRRKTTTKELSLFFPNLYGKALYVVRFSSWVDYRSLFLFLSLHLTAAVKSSCMLRPTKSWRRPNFFWVADAPFPRRKKVSRICKIKSTGEERNVGIRLGVIRANFGTCNYSFSRKKRQNLGKRTSWFPNLTKNKTWPMIWPQIEGGERGRGRDPIRLHSIFFFGETNVSLPILFPAVNTFV